MDTRLKKNTHVSKYMEDLDVLYSIAIFVHDLRDYNTLFLISKGINHNIKQLGFVGFFYWVQKKSGIQLTHTFSNFLWRHILNSNKTNATLFACDSVISQFESTKCIFQHHCHVPVKLDLAYSICPHVNEFRASHKSLSSRLCKKMLEDAVHECNRLFVDEHINTLCKQVLYALYLPYNSIVLGHRSYPLYNNAQINIFVKTWVSKQIYWSPTLDPSSAIYFTRIDTEQIEHVLDIVVAFVDQFKRCMNKSSIFAYQMYRGDIRDAKRVVKCIRHSLQEHSSCLDVQKDSFVSDVFSFKYEPISA